MTSAQSPAARRTGTQRSLLQKLALAVGSTFLLVGILGFIPGLTTNFEDMRFAGPQSDAHLLGIFQVSVLHNIVHLLFGLAGLLMARSSQAARSFLIGSGLLYLLLWLYGLVVGQESDANFVPFNMADDWLHLLLGAGMLGLGLLAGKGKGD